MKKKKPARLMNPCKGNAALARIIFGDGSHSMLLITKRQALTIGETMVGIRMTRKEWEMVKEEIRTSKLIARSKGLETFVFDVENTLRLYGRKLAEFMRKLNKEK